MNTAAALLVLLVSAPLWGLAGAGCGFAHGQGKEEKPVADPGGPYQAEVGSPVTFNGLGSSDPDGVIVRYDWELGEATATGPVAVRSFDHAGEYRIRLEVTDDDGRKDERDTRATIGPAGSGNVPPTAVPDAAGTTEGVPVVIDVLANDIDPDTPPQDLTVFDWTNGEQGGTVRRLEDNRRLEYTPPPGFTGTDRFDYEAFDGQAESDEALVTVTVSDVANQPPTASIDEPAAGETVEVGEPVHFRGSGSDPDGGPVTFQWTFPDGTPPTSAQQEQDVTFSVPGSKTVRLRVTDDEGGSTDAERTINVVPAGGGDLPPTAEIRAPDRNVTITAGDSVQFAGEGSDPDGGPVTFSWTFPGGVPSSSSERVPGFVRFPTRGSFRVQLVVRDNEGSTTEAARFVFVAAGNQAPSVTINQPEKNPLVIAPGDSVSFAGSAADPDGTVVSLSWSFPGGAPPSSPLEDPGFVRFDEPGIHEVVFSATDDDGATSTDRRTILVGAGVDPAALNVDTTSPGSADRIDGHDAIFVLRGVQTQDPAADVNADGAVDELDVQLVVAALGEVP